MKTFIQTLFFFLLITQICSAQLYQQNRESNSNIKKDLFDRQDKHFRIIDRNITGNKFHEFPTSKIPDKFGVGKDTINVNGISHPFPNDRFYANGHKTNLQRTNKTLSPPSQIYVIDTAIVISEQDTTRHLYSFNASAKKTSDIMQKLIGGIWVDYNMYTYTYDANNNMLTALYEFWDNGQLWGNRQTYTYDANNNMLTCLSEDWNPNNQQWVNLSRNTYAYDTNNNMLTDSYEYCNNGQ